MSGFLQRRNLFQALICSAVVMGGSKCLAAETPAELVDLASRIDYGFYAAEIRTLAAAYRALIQRSSQHAADTYYAAYAAYRLSQIEGPASLRRHQELVGECVRSARKLTSDSAWSIEAWILIAACSVEGRMHDQARTLSHEIRLTEALRAARALDPNHPRLLLIDARAQLGAKPAEASLADSYQFQLEKVRSSFESWRGSGSGFDWGRAEVLTDLATIHAANGRRREARDLIEEALIEAPDYHVALSLKNTLLSRP